MVEFRAEISPYGNTMSRSPPGSESKAEHVKRAHRGGRTDCNPEQQANSNGEFDRPDQITEKHGVWQNQIGKNGLIKADCTSLGVTLQVLLKAAVREFRAE